MQLVHHVEVQTATMVSSRTYARLKGMTMFYEGSDRRGSFSKHGFFVLGLGFLSINEPIEPASVTTFIFRV